MPIHDCRRVFILGAGFSKPAGFPLATDLTSQLADRYLQIAGKDHDFAAFVEHVHDLHTWLNRAQPTTKLNVEEFFDYVSILIEHQKLDQHLCRVGRHDGDGTAWVESETYDTWLKNLESDLLDVLSGHDQKADLGPIIRFAEHLRPSDVVITFNYDVLLERSLNELGTRWSHGLDDHQDGAIPILKPHGSMDWIRQPRSCKLSIRHTSRIFSKVDENRSQPDRSKQNWHGEDEYDWELHRFVNLARCHEFIKNQDVIQADFAFGLAGLGPSKAPSRIAGLGAVWKHARDALFNAVDVTIIGFSFSPFDRLAVTEFGRVTGGRDQHDVLQPRVRIVDPYGGDELIERLRVVFDDPELVRQMHEDTNWGTWSPEA